MEDHGLDSLEMAKKRDRKVMITEEAINKVPYIEYREIPTEEYEIIYRLIKQVLQLSKEENDSNEVAITYSFDSDKAISQEEVASVCNRYSFFLAVWEYSSFGDCHKSWKRFLYG